MMHRMGTGKCGGEWVIARCFQGNLLEIIIGDKCAMVVTIMICVVAVPVR
jgi:hypothetical protein